MKWIVVFLIAVAGFVIFKRKKIEQTTTVWSGSCPPTTFTYRDSSDRRRVTVQPIKLIRKGKYQDLIAIDSNGTEKIFFCQLIDSMLATEGHKKKHFDDWVNDVLLAQTESSAAPNNLG